MNRIEFEKECYLLSRYRDDYITSNTFDKKATALIQAGLKLPAESDGLSPIEFMEEMLKQKDLYAEMDKKYAPILIYTGDKICYGVLSEFALRMGEALSQRGYTVEFYDLEAGGAGGLFDFVGKRYKAVIGMQTYAFSVRTADGTNLHDRIIGPKFNMIFDHPVWLKNHLINGPKDYYVLTHDKNYVDFANRYFPAIKGAYLIPPGGSVLDGAGDTAEEKKEYDISFVGSYHDWRAWWHQIREMNKKTDGLVRAFMTYAKRHPDETWESGLRAVLKSRGEELSDEEFRDLLFDIKPVCFVVMSFYRERLLDALAGADIALNVFGDSWKTKRYKESSFIIHDEVSPRDSLIVYKKSRISLNIMSWHKAGMTERLANMMLNKSAVATDESAYLSENYISGEDYIALSLTDVKSAPAVLKEALSDDRRLSAMSERAYEKAHSKETWACRADEFIAVLNRIGEE